MRQQEFFEKKQTELGVALNDMQKQAVVHTDGPLLLLATPGSGKTTTLIMRIGYLIEALQVPANKIKALTFSRAAAKDMDERFEMFFPELDRVSFSTIHSLAFAVVRDYFDARNETYQLIEGNNVGYLNKRMILRNLYEEINGRVITADHLEELLSYISFIKNRMIPREKWQQVKCDVKAALEIFERYEAFKQDETATLLLDYDDMLTIAHTAFEENANILAAYQTRFDYVLTDESQDTSLVQHAIIEKLVAAHKNICVVADDDQSIYTWRAAEPQYLLDFKEVYPEATILTMEQNYRSSNNIVSTANTFIKQNKDRYDKDMFTENEAGEPMIFRALQDYREQTNYLLGKIGEAENYADIAILFRNNLSAIVLVDAFDKANIPFYMKDTDNHFFEHWIVEDMLNFMRLAYDDTRVSTLEKIYAKFNGYISKVQLKSLKQDARMDSVFDRLCENPHLKEYQVKNLQAIKQHFEQIKTSTPSDIIQIIRTDLEYDKQIERISERFGFNITYLHEILYILEEIAVGTKTMEEFAKRLNYLKDLLRQAHHNQGNNAVTLSTLHSSKGLEFEAVYMIDLIEGNLPSQHDIDALAKSDAKPMEEATRLFYVGMTRAASRLELVSYRKKVGVSVDVSRFYQTANEIVDPEAKQRRMQDEKTKQTTRKQRQAISRDPNAISSEEALIVGISVKHRVFGIGKISDVDKSEIKIRFKQEEKRLLISACIEYGILSVAE